MLHNQSYGVTLIFLASVLLLSMNGFSQKMPRMDYPKGFLDRKSQKELKRYYKQGFALYKANCSRCHGPNEQLKEITPFTDAQIQNYSLRSSTQHAPVFRNQSLSETELTQILTFLKFMEKPQTAPQ